jgi:hypothetical protein
MTRFNAASPTMNSLGSSRIGHSAKLFFGFVSLKQKLKQQDDVLFRIASDVLIPHTFARLSEHIRIVVDVRCAVGLGLESFEL